MRKSMLQIIKQSVTNILRKKDRINIIENREDRQHVPPVKFSNDMEYNFQMIKSCLGKSDDLKHRCLEISTLPGLKAMVIYIETISDGNKLESSVLTPLTQSLGQRSPKERRFLHSNIEDLIKTVLSNSDISYIEDVAKAAEEILSGNGLLLIHNHSKSISVKIARAASKKFAEPQTEKVVKGPQQGFVEDLDVNISLIRKRIKSPNLVVKGLKIGRQSHSETRVFYMDNITDMTIVDELFNRLKRINVDGAVGSGAIDEYISDTPSCLFPTTFSTERPDRVQAMLLEGRIAILFDNSPFAIVVPTVVSDFFISSDDYYQNPFFATFGRFIGYLGGFMLTFLPSIYIALTTYHQEMFPTALALTIAGARAGVPLPAFLEALIMEISFEALRQAGTRLPTHIGQAVSIVGALIIGQAAVEAGLVSSTVVIVVATTAIFSFTMPYTNFSLGLRLTRFAMMALAATLGIYGIMTGALLLALKLISLRSFGVPFLLPFAPVSLKDMKDWVARFPQWAITSRSSYIVKENNTKKSKDLKPKPLTNERVRKS